MKRQKNKKKWVIAGTVIALSVVALSFMSLQGNSVYFYTTDEVMKKASDLQNQEIRVGGMVKSGTVQWDRQTVRLNFVLTNFKGNELNVEYLGTPPDMFKENSGAVVEGRLETDGKNFKATKLMVKHSEEYRKPDASHSMDKQLLEKSIFKDKPS